MKLVETRDKVIAQLQYPSVVVLEECDVTISCIYHTHTSYIQEGITETTNCC